MNRPIASLLLGANCNEMGGSTQFYGGANGGNLPTIGSPLSAFNTVFGTSMPAGMQANSQLARRKSILDTITAEITGLQATLGSNEKAKLDAHLGSIRPSKTSCSPPPRAPSRAPSQPPPAPTARTNT